VKRLLVFCHPDPHSYGAALKNTAVQALTATGHELRQIDLYAEGFNPVFSAAEKQTYLSDSARNIEGVAAHVQALRWAEGWVVVYRTIVEYTWNHTQRLLRLPRLRWLSRWARSQPHAREAAGCAAPLMSPFASRRLAKGDMSGGGHPAPMASATARAPRPSRKVLTPSKLKVLPTDRP